MKSHCLTPSALLLGSLLAHSGDDPTGFTSQGLGSIVQVLAVE